MAESKGFGAMSGSTATPTRCSPPSGPYNSGRFHLLKINHEKVKSPRKFGRTELISDRRGSADVEPFRSLFRVPPAPSSRSRQGVPSPPHGKPNRGGRPVPNPSP